MDLNGSLSSCLIRAAPPTTRRASRMPRRISLSDARVAGCQALRSLPGQPAESAQSAQSAQWPWHTAASFVDLCDLRVGNLDESDYSD